MQRMFCIYAIYVAFLCFAGSTGYCQYICGDANADSAVNVSDAVWIINYVFIGGPEPDPFLTGEVNCDGSVNVSDVVWIINYVFVGGNDPCDAYPGSPGGDGIPDCDPNCPAIVEDIDGNFYQTVFIGGRCWMAENLKVTKYRNGDPVPNVADNASWEGLSSGAYCYYENNDANADIYGRLYNFYAVADSRGLAPDGWHVPTDADWKQLEMFLGMSQSDADDLGWRGTDEGGKLKEAGTTHWQSPNTGATNETGFSALPGGYRSSTGHFYFMGYDNYYWSSSQYDGVSAYYRYLNYYHSEISRNNIFNEFGYSVRCVKDQ